MYDVLPLLCINMYATRKGVESFDIWDVLELQQAEYGDWSVEHYF